MASTELQIHALHKLGVNEPVIFEGLDSRCPAESLDAFALEALRCWQAPNVKGAMRGSGSDDQQLTSLLGCDLQLPILSLHLQPTC